MGQRDWSPSYYEERLRELGLFICFREEKAHEGSDKCVWVSEGKVLREWIQTLLVVPRDRKRGNRHKQNHEENLIYCEGYRLLEQFAHRCCGVSQQLICMYIPIYTYYEVAHLCIKVSEKKLNMHKFPRSVLKSENGFLHHFKTVIYKKLNVFQ